MAGKRGKAASLHPAAGLEIGQLLCEIVVVAGPGVEFLLKDFSPIGLHQLNQYRYAGADFLERCSDLYVSTREAALFSSLLLACLISGRAPDERRSRTSGGQRGRSERVCAQVWL